MPSCEKDSDAESDNTFNLFSVNDDLNLGQQIDQEIMSKPTEYPILSKTAYPLAYGHLERIRDMILNTGLVAWDDKFPYEVKIINDDNVLNAFATPGGYMYFYTGLIKYLDNEAQFAGVMAHEMAHVARRHSTDQLTKQYGLSLLASIILGNNASELAEIAAGLATGLSSLAFSRTAEYEADAFAVKYTYSTELDGRGIAGFFTKIEGSPTPPEFLSTHPSPENRVEKITETWQNLGGASGLEEASRYADFKSSLP